MAHRSQDPSPSGSPSPTATSSNVSPRSRSASLATMVPVPDDYDSPSSRSARGTPNRHPTDLPRIPAASKGGCWTCRLRRKKCDEQREGDSCRTCRRLTIECLGWGPKRPEWMRDKQAVEDYKANIKAQLTRAGLIRGQPRAPHAHQHPSSAVSTQIRPHPYHRASAPDITSASPLHFDHPDYGYRYVNTPQEQHTRPDQTLIPGMPGASNSSFHQITDPLYTDTTLDALDLHTTFYSYPQSVTPISSSSSVSADIGFDVSQLGTSQEPSTFDFDLRLPSPPAPVPFIAGQGNIEGEHVIYYFEHVRKIQLMFAGNTFTNATYSMILQDPRGAVTNAVCALASLHYTRMRIAQGLEPPDPNPEHSNAKYFHGEAYFQLETAKQLNGTYSDKEALAALHLVCYSQLSGGSTSWQPAFHVMCEWLAQTGLLADENPAITLHAMSPTGQLLVKATLWLDTFSSLTVMRPPKYLRLLKHLLGERGGYWPAVGDCDGLHSLRMDLLTGCPDEAMLALAETANLAHWKATEQRNGTLSSRELVRRGDDIEQRLRQHHSNAAGNLANVDQAPLHPTLVQAAGTEPRMAPFPSDEGRHLVAKIFCEAAVLSLHTVLSNPNPGVQEIGESVETIIRLLDEVRPSEIDRTMVYPICLAGSMSDDSSRREFCKGRLQHLDGSIGNLMQTRLVMEAIWQKRDVNCGVVDFRETIRERGLNLLLI
ncbi:putative fungal specific transcription factor [Lyophyllum shimeji]|uniref:Fungal specific transcription factor n=1 Tax=Lyophyllum shimeji TaxID=47721 RepID=A0A9P3PQU8_LYOSH|nr:putative fungal specific transcription factor [Lyophyllum shimeji]